MLEELSTTIGAAEQQPGRVEFKAEIDYPALLRAQSARDAEPSSCVALCPGIHCFLLTRRLCGAGNPKSTIRTIRTILYV